MKCNHWVEIEPYRSARTEYSACTTGKGASRVDSSTIQALRGARLRRIPPQIPED